MTIVKELAKELPVTKLRKVKTSLLSQKKEIEESLDVVEELIGQKEAETEGNGSE